MPGEFNVGDEVQRITDRAFKGVVTILHIKLPNPKFEKRSKRVPDVQNVILYPIETMFDNYFLYKTFFSNPTEIKIR